MLFWSDGCGVANLDWADNFLAAILYSPTSTVVAAKGTTNSSGGMGKNGDGFFAHNIATSLSHGDSVGDAVVNHVSVPLVAPYAVDREFLLRDPHPTGRSDDATGGLTPQTYCSGLA